MAKRKGNKLRKIWKINPKTRIVPNKKRKSTAKLSQKEIQRIRLEEDF